MSERFGPCRSCKGHGYLCPPDKKPLQDKTTLVRLGRARYFKREIYYEAIDCGMCGGTGSEGGFVNMGMDEVNF